MRPSFNSALVNKSTLDSASSLYLNQHFLIVNWTHGETVQCILNQNTTIFIQEHSFENVVCKMSAILFQSRRDNQGQGVINMSREHGEESIREVNYYWVTIIMHVTVVSHSRPPRQQPCNGTKSDRTTRTGSKNLFFIPHLAIESLSNNYISHWTHNALMTSTLCKNDTATLFSPNNDIITYITSCVRWDGMLAGILMA